MRRCAPGNGSTIAVFFRWSARGPALADLKLMQVRQREVIVVHDG